MLISSIHIEYRNNPHLDESQQQLWVPRLGTLNFRKIKICTSHNIDSITGPSKTPPRQVRKCMHGIRILIVFNYIKKCKTYVSSALNMKCKINFSL
jgi:hypothetical protein